MFLWLYENWELTVCGEALGEVGIKRKIFQGENLPSYIVAIGIKLLFAMFQYSFDTLQLKHKLMSIIINFVY